MNEFEWVAPVDLLPGDVLSSGGMVICTPYQIEKHYSVVLRYTNREVRIQSWDLDHGPVKVTARGQET